jgi:CubicO group peptidase (beta-lactamase class C family)
MLLFIRVQPIHAVRNFGFVLGALIGVAVFQQPSSAQSLTYTVFGETLESLAFETGIPGMSAAIVKGGVVAWSRGLGKQDVEGNVVPRGDTPYLVGSLSQTIGATLLLRKCMDQSWAELGDRVERWAPAYPEPTTTIGELLTHTAPDGSFRYDPARLAALTDVVEQCATERYPALLAAEIFDRLAMVNSVPGQALAAPTSEDVSMFGAARLARYGDILRKVAVPYRMIGRRPVRNTELVPTRVDIARGIVSSVLDLAQFDSAFDTGILIAQSTRVQALSQAFANGRPLPTGLGWFLQAYNGEPIAWQFGVVEDGYSSLIVKVPNRRLTLILLANNDGLSRPFALEAGDVTTSIFAKTFLKTFVP